MAKVEIVRSLFEDIKAKFKGESHKVIDLLESFEQNPQKGKTLGNVGGIIIKELKYKSFRFYFITNGFKLKFLRGEELTDLLLKFVKLSDKKTQQKVINEIKQILQTIGPKGFI
jgi:hypothetical protein